MIVACAASVAFTRNGSLLRGLYVEPTVEIVMALSVPLVIVVRSGTARQVTVTVTAPAAWVGAGLAVTATRAARAVRRRIMEFLLRSERGAG